MSDRRGAVLLLLPVGMGRAGVEGTGHVCECVSCGCVSIVMGTTGVEL